MLREPFGEHPAFGIRNLAVIPKGKLVLPVFTRASFTTANIECFEVPEATKVDWYVKKDNIFKAPTTIVLDTNTTVQGNGTSIIEFLKVYDNLMNKETGIDEWIFTGLSHPYSDALKGRQFFGFLFHHADLVSL
jgi:hypothetical protein